MVELLKNVTFEDVLQMFGMIAVVAGGVKIIVNLFAPFQRLKAEVSDLKGYLKKHDQRLEEGDKKMQEFDKKIDKLDEALSVLGLAIRELINHTVTGNDIEELKNQQKKLDEYFYRGREE